MSRTLVIGAVIIILAGIAYYVGFGDGAPATSPDQNATSTVSGDESDGVFTVVDPVMVGTWKSKEDAKFSREFKADGTVVDRYSGDASATATGTFVTIDPSKVEVPGVPKENLMGMTVIRTMWEGEGAPMFFSINSMTDVELSMTNLSGRGNILMFTKVK